MECHLVQGFRGLWTPTPIPKTNSVWRRVSQNVCTCIVAVSFSGCDLSHPRFVARRSQARPDRSGRL